MPEIMENSRERQNTTAGFRLSLRWIYGLLALFSLLVLLNSTLRFFDHDEFEHIHSAWYIQQGDLPYRDFYQNHHPLFWLLLLPLLKIFGHSVFTIMTCRGLMLLMVAGIGFAVYKIATLATRSREVRLFALLLLMSMVVFVEKGLEVRPDVPQVLLGLWSFFYILLFFKNRRLTYLTLSGISASISFLFLQKALLLLLVYGLIFVYKLIRREMFVKEILLFLFCFILPLLPFWIYLMSSGSWSDYVLTNWVLNARQLAPFSLLRTLKDVFVENPLTWLLYMVCLWRFLVRREGCDDVRMLTAAGLLMVLFSFGIRHPHQQYLIFPVSLLAVPAAHGLRMIFVKFRLTASARIRAWVLITLVPFVFLFFRLLESNHSQLRRIDYVLKNSSITDLVYDGDIKFNLFRRDLHYFWYSVKANKGLDSYNRITGGRYADYDVCRLILEKKPRFISNYFLDMSTCGPVKMYRKTKHKNLYVKIEK